MLPLKLNPLALHKHKKALQIIVNNNVRNFQSDFPSPPKKDVSLFGFRSYSPE